MKRFNAPLDSKHKYAAFLMGPGRRQSHDMVHTDLSLSSTFALDFFSSEEARKNYKNSRAELRDSHRGYEPLVVFTPLPVLHSHLIAYCYVFCFFVSLTGSIGCGGDPLGPMVSLPSL